MSTEISRILSPEERELEKKREELARLGSELADRELELATLLAELRAFEARYLRIVGLKYTILDDLNAQIAEARARATPKDKAAQERASEARTKARESSQVTESLQDIQRKFSPSEDLKRLYRNVAKQIHPDLATNDSDRRIRHEMMAEANLAYEKGDEVKLESILRNWNTSPETVKGEGVGAELVRILRKIAQAEQRLREISAELSGLVESHYGQLKLRVEKVAHEDGRDLLAEMADELDRKIDEAKIHLEIHFQGVSS